MGGKSEFMKTAIIFSQKKYLDIIATLCSKYATKYNIEVEKYFTCEEYLEDTVSDLVILGIDFIGMSGIQLKEKLMQIESKTKIIFISNHTEKMRQAFGKNVYAFLNKPINYIEFYTVMEQILREFTAEQKMPLISDGIERNVTVSDIVYIKSMDKYTVIHTYQKQYIVRKTMKDWEKCMDKNIFYRVHRSYLINLMHITKCGKEIVLDKKYRIPLSKSRKQEFYEKIKNYL